MELTKFAQSIVDLVRTARPNGETAARMASALSASNGAVYEVCELLVTNGYLTKNRATYFTVGEEARQEQLPSTVVGGSKVAPMFPREARVNGATIQEIQH